MKARAVAALAVVFAVPWTAANDRAIERIHDAKTRQAERAVFVRTVAELHAAQRESPVRTAPEAQKIAQTILSDRATYAFGSVQKPPPKTWWQRLQEWIGERWAALIKALFGRARMPAGVNAAIGDVLLGLSILAFIALLARLLITYSRRSLPADPRTYAVRSTQNAATFAARAFALAARGDFNGAAAAIFRAALHVLADRGALQADDARTVGELRRRIRAESPHLAAQFDVLARLLTQSVYAQTPLTHADWEDARAAYERLKVSATQPDAA